MDEWNRLRVGPIQLDAPYSYSSFEQYLEWLKKNSRLRLNPTWTDQDILEENDDEANEFNLSQREGTQMLHAPVFDRVVCITYNLFLLLCNSIN